jgi:hypothetical protein
MSFLGLSQFPSSIRAQAPPPPTSLPQPPKCLVVCPNLGTCWPSWKAWPRRAREPFQEGPCPLKSPGHPSPPPPCLPLPCSPPPTTPPRKRHRGLRGRKIVLSSSGMVFFFSFWVQTCLHSFFCFMIERSLGFRLRLGFRHSSGSFHANRYTINETKLLPNCPRTIKNSIKRQSEPREL